jgi:uncharacterized membrane protein
MFVRVIEFLDKKPISKIKWNKKLYLRTHLKQQHKTFCKFGRKILNRFNRKIARRKGDWCVLGISFIMLGLWIQFGWNDGVNLKEWMEQVCQIQTSVVENPNQPLY